MIKFYYPLEQLQYIAYSLAILLMLAMIVFFAIRAICRAVRSRRLNREFERSDEVSIIQHDHKQLWDLFSSVSRRTDKHADLVNKRLDDIEATLRTILPKPDKKTKASKASPRR